MISYDTKLDFDDVLIQPAHATGGTVIKSRKNVSLMVNYQFPHSKQSYTGVPIFASNMSSVGTIKAAKKMREYGMSTTLHKFIDHKDITHSQLKGLSTEDVIPTFGVSELDKKNLDALIKENHYRIKFISIDVANGYIDAFIQMIKHVRKKYPHLTIIAGSVCTFAGAREVYLAGADIIRVGIGSGANCTTRIKTGIGYPQFSAIHDIIKEFKPTGMKPIIMSDGGCRAPGDIAKAFGIGAKFVMLGTMLAAHNENSPSERIVEIDEKYYVKVFGMSSETALHEHYSDPGVYAEIYETYKSPEGRTTLIPHRGPLNSVLNDITGGLRSACTYMGKNKLQNIIGNANFIRVNNQYNTSAEHLDITNK